METFDIFIYRKSKAFALRIIRLYKYLLLNRREYVISRQILRCGTSIGANIAESKFAQSNSDLISKLSIARKEANETRYWLDLLYESEEINLQEYSSMLSECEELIKILTSAILSLLDKGK